MLEKLITLLPREVQQRARAFAASRRKSEFEGMDPKSAFTHIYKTNYWKGKESLSGTGSDKDQTRSVVEIVEKVIRDYKIASILDVPCGDYYWMRDVNKNGASYVGADIVDDLIIANQKFASDKVSFRSLNIISDPIPKSDLIICRDGLVHLSFEDIETALDNLRHSGSHYLLCTTFPRHTYNYDITTGDWRALNMQKAPFFFGEPIALFNENPNDEHREYRDKSLGLWSLREV